VISSPIAVVARQVLMEAVRRRTLPVLVLFGSAVIFSSAFLTFFQMGTEIKFFKDVATTVIFLFGTVATLVLVSTQLSGEIETRTIYNVLSKPIRRWELVVGKFVGSIVAIALAIAPMVAVLMFFIYVDKGGSMLEAVKTGYLLWLTFAVLSAIALGIASFASSIITGTLTVLLFVVSYLKGAVTTYLALAGGIHAVSYVCPAPYYLLPNFENFNIRTAFVHDQIVPWTYLGRTSLYALALIALFLYVGVQIFEEREF